MIHSPSNHYNPFPKIIIIILLLLIFSNPVLADSFSNYSTYGSSYSGVGTSIQWQKIKVAYPEYNHINNFVVRNPSLENMNPAYGWTSTSSDFTINSGGSGTGTAVIYLPDGEITYYFDMDSIITDSTVNLTFDSWIFHNIYSSNCKDGAPNSTKPAFLINICSGNKYTNAMFIASGKTNDTTYDFSGEKNYTVTDYNGTNTILFSNTTNYYIDTNAILLSQNSIYVSIFIEGSPASDIIGKYRLSIYDPSNNYMGTSKVIQDFYSGSYPIQFLYENFNDHGEGYYRFELIDFVNATELTNSYLLLYNGSNNTQYTPPTTCNANEVCGYTSDINGNKLDNATVTIHGTTIYTNGYGFYNMSIPYNADFFYEISKDGYSGISGLQFFSKGTRYDFSLPFVSQGLYQYIDFHVTGEGTAQIYKNGNLLGNIDNDTDIIGSFLIGDTLGWIAIPNANQSFINVCDTYKTICYTELEKTISVTAIMPEQYDFTFTGVQKPNPNNASEYTLNPINKAVNDTGGIITTYNYTASKSIFDYFIPPIFSMMPAELWGLVILGWSLELVLIFFKR